jgi:hypothetical protein
VHLELPLEQLVRRRGKGAQLSFATEAMQHLPRRNDFVPAPSPLSLHLLARDEEALEGANRALSDVYGERLDVLPPKVRVIEGLRQEEPIMHVEITVDRRREDAEFERLFSVMRYDAPLADLLGLEAELDRLTAGKALCWMALSHYAHVERNRKERK